MPTQPAPTLSLSITRLLLGHGVSEESSALPTPMAALKPEGADDLVWFLAAHAAAPGAAKPLKRPRPADSAETVDLYETHLAPVLLDFPRGLHELMSAIEAASGSDSAGVSRVLGRWYRLLRLHFSDDRYQWLHDEVAAFVAAELPVTVNDRTSRIPRALAAIKGWLSVAEAARVVGVAPERLRNALRHGDVPGVARTGAGLRDLAFVRREVVRAVQEQRAGYIVAKEAMRRFDVTKLQLERLVAAGGLTRHEAADRPALVDAPFRRDEVEALMLSLEARVLPRDEVPVRQVRLGDIAAERGRGDAFVRRAYRAIVTGEVVPRVIDADVQGIGRFVFDADEVDAIAVGDPQDTQITLTQLFEITGWKPEAVSRWIEAGLLRARRTQNGRAQTSWLRLDDILRFLTMNIVVSDLAGACASRSRYILEGLNALGCDFVQFENSSGQRFASVVRFENLGKAVLERRRREGIAV